MDYHDIFSPVKQDSVPRSIVLKIRKAILEGKIRPGDRLPPEHKLVEKLQASKFSVREALRTLEVLGFLEVKKGPDGGAVITEVGLKPIKYSLFNFLGFQNVTAKNLCEIRMLIEPGVAEIAATRRKKEDLEGRRER